MLALLLDLRILRTRARILVGHVPGLPNVVTLCVTIPRTRTLTGFRHRPHPIMTEGTATCIHCIPVITTTLQSVTASASTTTHTTEPNGQGMTSISMIMNNTHDTGTTTKIMLRITTGATHTQNQDTLILTER